MNKKIINFKIGVIPVPNLIVTCRGKDGKNNALVVSCACNVSTNPPLVTIGIAPNHYSYQLIQESGEFVINIPPKGYDRVFYYIGTKSGKDEDKFAALNLPWEEGTKVAAPLLSDCPMCVECKVTKFVETGGDHNFFIGKIEAVHCDESWLDSTGNLDPMKISVFQS